MSEQSNLFNPVFLSSEQFAHIFNQGVRESLFLNEVQGQAHQDTMTPQFRDMSFAIPVTDRQLDGSIALTGSLLGEFQTTDQKETEQKIFITKEQFENFNQLADQNKQLLENYQRIQKQNKELMTKRKELESENEKLLDDNFQIKRQTQDLQTQLASKQHQIQIKKDKEILQLKQQVKDLQHKLTFKDYDRDSAPKPIKASLTEVSTANSTKSQSGITFGNNLLKQEHMKCSSKFTSPLSVKVFEPSEFKTGFIGSQLFQTKQ